MRGRTVGTGKAQSLTKRGRLWNEIARSGKQASRLAEVASFGHASDRSRIRAHDCLARCAHGLLFAMNVPLPNACCVRNRQEDGTLAYLENDPIASMGAIGAGEMNRTPDLRITNALLYQLSYTGTLR